MADTVRIRYEVDDRDLLEVKATLDKIEADLKRIDTEAKGVNFKPMASGANLATGAIGGIGSGLSKLVPAISAAFAVTKIVQFGKHALELAGSLEQTRVAMTTMLGSQRASNAMIAQTLQLAAKTPYEFPELANTVKQLLAFNISQDKALEVTRRLGDIASGTGTDLGGLAFVVGQVNAQGRAMTQDLNQFAARGIPIYEELGKVFGVNAGEVRKFAEQGKIGFKEVEKAITNLTDEGGMFFGMMEAQSATFEGKLSTFNDAWDALVRTLGEELLPVTSDVLDFLTDILDVQTTYSESLKEEQANFNALVQGYTSALKTLDDTAESKKLLDYYTKELNKEYPAFLKNLGDEAQDLSEIEQQMALVNTQYERRFKNAGLEEAMAGAGEKLKNSQRDQFEAATRFREMVFKVNEELEKQNKPLIDINKNLWIQRKALLAIYEQRKKETSTDQQTIAGLFETGDAILAQALTGLKAYQDYREATNGVTEGVMELKKATDTKALLFEENDIQVINGYSDLIDITGKSVEELGAIMRQVKQDIGSGWLDDKQSKIANADVEILTASIAKLTEAEARAAEAAKRGAKEEEKRREAAVKFNEKMNEAIADAIRSSDEVDTDIWFEPTWDEKQAKEVADEAKRLKQTILDDEDAQSAYAADREFERKKELVDQIGELERKSHEDQIARQEELRENLERTAQALDTLGQFYSALSELADVTKTKQEEADIARIEAEKERFINSAKDKDAARLRSEQLYDSQIKKIEEQQYRRRKKAAIAEAVISNALLILKALNTGPVVPNLVAAGIAAGLGAIQVATVAKAGFAKGGYTGDGGKYDPAGVVHRGEFVFDKAYTTHNRDMLEWLHKNRINIGDLMRGVPVPVAQGGPGSKNLEKGVSRLVQLAERDYKRTGRDYRNVGASSRFGWKGASA